MAFPERFVIQHEARTEGELDRQGNPVVGFADPVERRVVTVYPPSDDDIVRAEQSGQVWHLAIISLAEWGAHKDRVTVDGVPYFVEGHAEDFTHHPWGFPGGYRLKLRRVNG